MSEKGTNKRKLSDSSWDEDELQIFVDEGEMEDLLGLDMFTNLSVNDGKPDSEDSFCDETESKPKESEDHDQVDDILKSCQDAESFPKIRNLNSQDSRSSRWNIWFDIAKCMAQEEEYWYSLEFSERGAPRNRSIARNRRKRRRFSSIKSQFPRTQSCIRDFRTTLCDACTKTAESRTTEKRNGSLSNSLVSGDRFAPQNSSNLAPRNPKKNSWTRRSQRRAYLWRSSLSLRTRRKNRRSRPFRRNIWINPMTFMPLQETYCNGLNSSVSWNNNSSGDGYFPIYDIQI